MSFTLISSIGSGMYDKTKNDATGYRETIYLFKNGKRITSRLFLFSILESGYWDIDHVILVGTRTSSWDVLLSNRCEAGGIFEDTWLHLAAECESQKGVSDESLDKLTEILQGLYSISFKIFVHGQVVDQKYLPSIFRVYADLPNSIPKDRSILLDITHGFRSMPMFLYQTLRFSYLKQSSRETQIIYGEFVPGSSISVVRDLSLFWELSEVSEEMDLFRTSFSGKNLANRLQSWWPQGARWMMGFTNLVQSNYVMQIRESMRQLHNALDVVKTENSPMWAEQVIFECRMLHNKLYHFAHLSDMLLAFSELLEERGLFTQAVIALQISVEARIIESMYDPKRIGDYTYWNAQGGPKEYKLKLEREEKLFALRELEHERNRIAHGGGVESWKSQPSIEAFPKKTQVERYRFEVKTLFDKCKVRT